jgi:Na+-transporting NADH:ubiquinone oxidoreductase subunit NqrE
VSKFEFLRRLVFKTVVQAAIVRKVREQAQNFAMQEAFIIWGIYFVILIGVTFVLAVLLKRFRPELHVAFRYLIAFVLAFAIFCAFLAALTPWAAA